MFRSTLRAMLAGLGLHACYSPEMVAGVETPALGGSGTGGQRGGSPESGSAGSSVGVGPALAGDGNRGATATPSRPVVEPVQLPAPCIGIPYAGQLEARGGAGGPHTWQALSPLPAGLELDANSGQISGSPVTDGAFSVRVTDRNGVESEPREFVLAKRQTCSFAYLSTERGPARLNLRDVFLSPATNVTLPVAAAADESVSDFEFSPDGAWIALRIAAGDRQRLALYSTRRDGSLALAADATPLALCAANEPECSVLDYAWSGNAQYLAVILRGANGRDALTGVRVAAPTEPWPRVSTAAWDVGPVPLDHRGQLVWVASDWVAFMGSDPGSANAASEALYTAAVGADGQSFVEPWVASAVTGVGTGLRATASGVVSSNPEADTLIFFKRSGGYPIGEVVRHAGGVLSPSQRLWVSSDADGVLRIWELELEGDPTFVSEAQTCTEIVAWSPRIEPSGAERFACRQGGTLKVFDYATTLEPVTEAPFAATLSGTRRAFSASGQWLVLAELAPESKRIALLDVARDTGAFDTIPAGCCTVMQLASGRDAVALAGEGLLSEYPLSSSGVERTLDLPGQPPPAAPCEDNFLRDPARWCGAPHVNNELEYSPEGQTLLFEWPPGTLSIADMSRFSLQVDATAQPVTDALAPCEGCRSKPYAFGH